jgi:hypothetical protein
MMEAKARVAAEEKAKAASGKEQARKAKKLSDRREEAQEKAEARERVHGAAAAAGMEEDPIADRGEVPGTNAAEESDRTGHNEEATDTTPSSSTSKPRGVTVAPPRKNLAASHRLGLDALASSIGSHFANAGMGAAFNLECDYEGMCTFNEKQSLVGSADDPYHRHKWDFVDVDIFFTSSVPSEEALAAGDDRRPQCFHSALAGGSRAGIGARTAASSPKDLAGAGVRFPNRKLDGSPDSQPRKSPQGVFHYRREHFNVAQVEGTLPNGTMLRAGHFHAVGSPAMFGAPIPSFDVFANEAVHRRNSSRAASGTMEGVNETEELDVDVLFTNLIMLQPFYYGCEDPLDLDPSLEGILMRDSSSRAEHPDEETVASGTEFGSAVPAPEIGLVLFRGECSFVAKARLVQWLGGSTMVVVDANTSSYVEDPSDLDKDVVSKDQARIALFFDDLFSGRVPVDFDQRAAAAAAAAAEAAAASQLAEQQQQQQQQQRNLQQGAAARKTDSTEVHWYDDRDGLDLFSMADDGTGRDIDVSSVFVSEMQGARIIRSIAFMQHCNGLQQSDARLSLAAEMVMRSSPPNPGSNDDVGSTSEGVAGRRLTFPLSSLSQIGIVPKNIILQIQRGLQASDQVSGDGEEAGFDVKSNL